MNRWMIRLLPLLMLVVTAAAQACPMCKDSVPASDAQAAGNVSAGFNLSIYFMLGAFFCVLAMVSFTLVKGARSTPVRGFPVNDDRP